MLDHRIEMIAEEWISAFNTQDIEALLSLYDANAKHYSPKLENEQKETNGWLRGKEQLREWWQRSFDTLPGLNYNLNSLTVDEREVFMKYTRRVPGQEKQEVWEYLQFDDLGFIVESRVLRSWTV